ncbi:hypothetical protein L7F22_029648 [Adiantum nelumboides]|nr:hypothetical protein [Adiantum nelumboides]
MERLKKTFAGALLQSMPSAKPSAWESYLLQEMKKLQMDMADMRKEMVKKDEQITELQTQVLAMKTQAAEAGEGPMTETSRVEVTNQKDFKAANFLVESSDATRQGSSTNLSNEADISMEQMSREGKVDEGAHAFVQEGCMEQSLRGSLVTYPRYRSVMEKNSFLQAMSLRESLQGNSSGAQYGTETEHTGRVLTKRGSLVSSFRGKNMKGDLERYSEKNGIESPDGDASQAGS